MRKFNGNSKEEIKERILDLDGRVDFFIEEVKRIHEHIKLLDEHLDKRVDRIVADKVYYKAVEDIEAYKKGEKIKMIMADFCKVMQGGDDD